MKPYIHGVFALVCGLLLSASSFAALGDNFSGKYEVLKGDCDATGLLMPGNKEVLVQADPAEFRVGQIFYTGDGGPDSQPYFQAAFDFQNGTVKNFCLGDCYFLYEGSYSTDGNSFTDSVMYATIVSAPPVYAGEYDFRLNGNQLEIDVTSTGQPTPSPKTVCLLKKVH